MHTSIRGLLAASILATSALVAAPAAAQDIELSGNSALVSEYRFRGVDLSGGDIAVQGGVDASIGGFYVGTWGSSIEENLGYGHTELDIYAGYGGSLGETLSFDVGALAYLYPNAPAGDFDYYELYGSLGAAIGPAEATFGVAYAPKQDSLDFGVGLPNDNLYVYTDVGVGIPNTPVSVSAHLGYTDGALTFTNNSKAFDWSIGADVAVGEIVSVGIAYIDAEDDFVGPGFNQTDSAVVLTLGASF